MPLALPPSLRDGRDPARAAARAPWSAQAREGDAVSRRLVVAIAQMTSTADVERNLAMAESLIAQAAARGAALAALPENFAFLRSEGEAVPEPQALDGAWVRRMADCARRHRMALLLGSIPERIEGDARVHNTSILLGADGAPIAIYRKIHLFDIDLPGMEHLKESRAVRPGEVLVAADVPLPDGGAARLGLTICYDLRFPELYRALVKAGARILAVPSAFTERTGKDHWEVLLRARAIENLAYVIAPAQVGIHGRGRASHGHALVVDPWGTVIAQVADGEGVAVAELDLDRQDRLRRELPALDHVRLG